MFCRVCTPTKSIVCNGHIIFPEKVQFDIAFPRPHRGLYVKLNFAIHFIL